MSDRLREQGLHRSSAEYPTPAEWPPAFAAGEHVAVPKFGAGIVETVEDDVVGVRLTDGTARRFKAEFVVRALPSEQGAA